MGNWHLHRPGLQRTSSPHDDFAEPPQDHLAQAGPGEEHQGLRCRLLPPPAITAPAITATTSTASSCGRSWLDNKVGPGAQRPTTTTTSGFLPQNAAGKADPNGTGRDRRRHRRPPNLYDLHAAHPDHPRNCSARSVVLKLSIDRHGRSRRSCSASTRRWLDSSPNLHLPLRGRAMYIAAKPHLGPRYRHRPAKPALRRRVRQRRGRSGRSALVTDISSEMVTAVLPFVPGCSGSASNPLQFGPARRALRGGATAVVRVARRAPGRPVGGGSRRSAGFRVRPVRGLQARP